MIRVHIAPGAEQVRADNGIGQVVHAMCRLLPEFDIELTGPDDAEVIAAHIQQGGLPRVDVLHCHGLYFGDIEHAPYHTWHHEANARIVDAARKALAITVPTRWVAEPFLRDMRLTPHVIGHGIDLDAWQPTEPKGYVLWNKNRAGDVCDPTPAWRLASQGARVISTFAPPDTLPPATMTVIGAQPHDTMRELVRHADIYLATTRETFGIGTLEALAAGVPVLGYDYGGTAELVEHQVSGYLVAPGDQAGLMAGLDWLRSHPETRQAARQRAQAFGWHVVMAQYAELYHDVAERRRRPSRVSVVITNYNYGQYVQEAIESVKAQTLPPAEIIIVDDGSTDSSAAVLDRIGVEAAQQEHGPQIRIITQANQGVAAARNRAIGAASADFIVCLDADDALDPRYVDVCQRALDADPGLGVAYTGLGLLQTDGSVSANDWPPAFDWSAQATPHNPPSNCIPCAAMFRRAMWERGGGYKQVYAPGEDTEFFTRGLSIGFTARKVTNELLFHYRLHDGSASRTKTYRPIDTWHPWMRDGKFPMAAPSDKPPLVKSYADPVISVVIPVGPGHAKYLPAALDSLLGQTLRDWEVIVVEDDLSFYENETREGNTRDRLLRTYPFIHYVWPKHSPGGVYNGAVGPGAARNAGLALARAPLVLFLDADDYLIPDALEKMLRAYAETGKYIYTDWHALNADGMTRHEVPDYRPQAWLETGQHAVTALIETAHARAVGGFDEVMRGWEDWDFFIKLAIAGVCGQRVAEPLLVYRQHTGTIREQSLARKDELLAALRDRYAAYATGELPMSTCCGGNADALLAAKRALAQANGELPWAEPIVLSGIEEPQVVRMEFTGDRVGGASYIGRPSGHTYIGGNNTFDKYINADPRDVDHLLSLGIWRVVPGQRLIQKPAEQTPSPTVASEPPKGPERAMLDLSDDLPAEQEQAVNAAAAKLAKTTRGKK